MKLAIAAFEVMMHLALGAPVVIEKIKPGVGELGVERAELREIERVVPSVVDAGEKTNQAPGTGQCRGARGSSVRSF